MTIDPRISFWFSVVCAIIAALIAVDTKTFVTLFGNNADKVTAILGILGAVLAAINAVLHAIPSSGAALTKEQEAADLKKFYLAPKSN